MNAQEFPHNSTNWRAKPQLEIWQLGSKKIKTFRINENRIFSNEDRNRYTLWNI